MKKNERIIWEYIIMSSISSGLGTAMICGLYSLFLLHHGISLSAIMVINAVYHITMFICEIPTGAFADVFGRKKSFVLSCFIVGVGMIIYAISSNIWGFILAEMVAAIGTTFKTGAFKSWVVDSLHHNGYKGDITKVFARENIYHKISSGIGAIVGTKLAILGMSMPWLVSGICLISLGIVANLILEENYFKHKKFSWGLGWKTILETMKTSIQYSHKSRAVRFVLCATFILIMTVQTLNMYWQPRFESLGIAKDNLGFVYTMIMIMTGIGAYTARQSQIGNEKKAIAISLLGTGIFVSITALNNALVWSLVFFMLHEVGRGFIAPLLDGYIHKEIPSKERATIVSLVEMAPHIGGFTGLLLGGLIVKYSNIETTWMISGLVMCIGFVFLYNGHKK